MGAGVRLDGWEGRLMAVIADHRDRPFEWGGKKGGSDCFMMAMDAAEALTGADPWAAERGRYTTRIGALRRFRANGFAWLADCYAETFNEIAPAMAQRGDIGLVTTRDARGREMQCSVVVMGSHAFGKSETGALRVPVSALTTAYRVG